MKRAGIFLLCACAFCSGHAWVSLAAARDDATTATAREVAAEGLRAFDEGAYAVAEAKLGQAYTVVKVPSLALYRARALIRLGRYVEASELLLEASGLEVSEGNEQVQSESKRQAAEERAFLLPKIPKVTVRVEGVSSDDVQVEFDGSPIPATLVGLPRPVDPGTHRVSATFRGTVRDEELTVREGEERLVTLRFRPEPVVAEPAATAPATQASSPAPPSDERAAHPVDEESPSVLAWTSLGVGAAGVVVGSVTGILALSKRSKLDDGGCEDGACYRDQRGAVDSYNSMRLLSTGGFVVGGIGIAAGSLLMMRASPSPEASTLRPFIGVGSAGVTGRF